MKLLFVCFSFPLKQPVQSLFWMRDKGGILTRILISSRYWIQHCNQILTQVNYNNEGKKMALFVSKYYFQRISDVYGIVTAFPFVVCCRFDFSWVSVQELYRTLLNYPLWLKHSSCYTLFPGDKEYILFTVKGIGKDSGSHPVTTIL